MLRWASNCSALSTLSYWYCEIGLRDEEGADIEPMVGDGSHIVPSLEQVVGSLPPPHILL